MSLQFQNWPRREICCNSTTWSCVFSRTSAPKTSLPRTRITAVTAARAVQEPRWTKRTTAAGYTTLVTATAISWSAISNWCTPTTCWKPPTRVVTLTSAKKKKWIAMWKTTTSNPIQKVPLVLKKLRQEYHGITAALLWCVTQRKQIYLHARSVGSKIPSLNPFKKNLNKKENFFFEKTYLYFKHMY